MMMKSAGSAGIFLAGLLTLAACSSAPSAPPSTDEPTPTASPTASPAPTEAQAAEPSLDGEWCPTPESSDDRCVTVAVPTVTWDDEVTDTLVDDPAEAPTTKTSYSFAGAPFGDYYPAGTSIELPDYYSGKDFPDQDRIWNPQTSVLLVRKDTSSVPPTSTEAAPVDGFPAELAGDWRSKDGTETFSLKELLKEHSEAFLYSEDKSEDVAGATDFAICLAPDAGPGECTTAASTFLRLFPVGLSWDCAKLGREEKLPFDFTKCDPDYTSEHNSLRARLIILPNHQHSQDYVDSMPMYKAGS